jgi:hypothetical protein
MKSLKMIALAFLAVLFASCQSEVEYPVEPRISYEGFTYLFYADSTFSGEGILSFSYTDGDGDLGLDDSDTLPPFGPNDTYYYNMIVDYMKCVNGEFVKMPLLSWNQQTQSYDTVSFNARFHRLRDTDEPKAISGMMDYTIPIQNPLSPNDTIKFEIHILDRAMHESNVIQTEAIITNPIFHIQQSGLPRSARNDVVPTTALRHCEEARRSNP